ncbi:MAG: ribonuclease PH [Thermoanaerobaculia bacterium]|nr:ribonuclease PH [Thermoanaerobaculia bacterium]
MSRPDGRTPLQLRPVSLEVGVVPHAEGSCLITQGRTKVLIAATLEQKIPPFLRDSGEGWITAEYGMLPRATLERTPREAAKGKQAGRTLEIQRLIGRALRGVADRTTFPEHTVTLDCDVLVADAGTRCASVTGAWVALALALESLRKKSALKRPRPFREAVAAISVGVLPDPERPEGVVALDLDYSEDSTAWVDLNVVGTSTGRYVEVQGTAEREPFDDRRLREMLVVGKKGLRRLFRAQRKALLGRVPEDWLPPA